MTFKRANKLEHNSCSSSKPISVKYKLLKCLSAMWLGGALVPQLNERSSPSSSGPQGFGENGYLFSGGCGALVIIFHGFGEQAHIFGD